MRIILSLCIIYNQNHMKEKLIWIRNNVLLTLTFAFLIVSVIMLGFYFCKFNNGFSTDNEDWESFGSYFASITGLLAFAGVLYTAWQSEQRANKAKEESIRREERDLFFKLLDLYQRQVDSINTQGDNGIIFLNNVAQRGNRYLISYIAMEGLRDKKDSIEYKETLISITTKYAYNSYIYGDIDTYIKLFFENGKIKDAPDYDLCKDYANNLMNSMSVQEIGKKMESVADIIYKEYGHILGQYYRTIFYLLHLTSGFKEKTEYYKIFRSQLSRYELLLLLYNVVSSQSTKEVKSLYKECDLFNNIIADDVLGYVNWNKKEEHTVSDFIDQLLNS